MWQQTSETLVYTYMHTHKHTHASHTHKGGGGSTFTQNTAVASLVLELLDGSNEIANYKLQFHHLHLASNKVLSHWTTPSQQCTFYMEE